MRIIDAPRSLLASALLLLLASPLAGIELILTQRSQWWRIPHTQIGIACALAFLFYAPVSWAVSRGSRVAWRTGTVVSAVWCALSALLSILREHTALAYFSIFLAGFLIVTFRWIAYELSRSFLDPRQSWFQGKPKEIPGLRCRVQSPGLDEQTSFRVCRLDTEGTFVFAPGASKPAPKHWKQAELFFKYRDSEVKCRGRVRGRLDAGLGLGFEFVGLGPDDRKDLGDFVERLRGVGYVD